MKPGSVEFISDGINTVEQDASVCAHCQHITSIPNRRKMMEHVDICRNCMRLVSLDCAGKPCTPYMKKIEENGGKVLSTKAVDDGPWSERMKCENCAHWVTSRVTEYGDGSVIRNWDAPHGKGDCDSLRMETACDFGCNYFEEGSSHIVTITKDGAPWQNFVIGNCPECGGRGSHQWNCARPVAAAPDSARCAITMTDM